MELPGALRSLGRAASFTLCFFGTHRFHIVYFGLWNPRKDRKRFFKGQVALAVTTGSWLLELVG